jgi:methylmalonyl-CoA epimerase
MRKIDHIAVAVRSLSATAASLETLLGIPLSGKEIIEEQGVQVGFFDLGGTSLELLEPLSIETPVGKFIEKKGEGLHHIAVQVDDLEGLLQDLVLKGIRLIDHKPRQGAHGKKIAFIHPSAAGGTLLELTETGLKE